LTGLRRALVSVAFAGVVAGAAAAALIVSSDHIEMPGLSIAIGLLIMWSFIGTGLYAWWRRPSNRFGTLMVAVGFTFTLGVLTASDESIVFTVGVLLSSLYFVVFAHMVLAYPDGRLQERWHAKLLAAGYALALVGPLPQLLWGFSPDMPCKGCPDSALLIEDNDSLRDVFTTIPSVLGVAIVAVVLAVLLRR
jgi:mannose/fructose/N-acetylgalactosamine-specific phosphotransferase system component IIC